MYKRVCLGIEKGKTMVQKLIGLVVVMFVVMSCGTPQQQAANPLQGYWQTQVVNTKQGSTTDYVLSFQDSLCLFLNANAPYAAYTYANDTLHIQQPEYDGTTLTDYTYTVAMLQDSVLALQPVSEAAGAVYPFRKRSGSAEVLFQKIPVVNDTQSFDGIAFYSTVCFGACPAMYLEIQADGTLLFQGQRYTDVEGWYTGTLRASDLQNLKRLVQSVPLTSVAKTYRAAYTDAATRAVLVSVGGKTYSSSVYGHSTEPAILTILLGTLQKLYQQTALTPIPDGTTSLHYADFYGKK